MRPVSSSGARRGKIGAWDPRSRSSARAAPCSPRNLLGDILGYEELAELRDRAVRHRRRTARDVRARRPPGRRRARRAAPRSSATTDRRAALDGADYAINMIQVGGYEPCTVTDFEVPKRFGLRQTIADTLGIGGIMRGLRTIPVLLDDVRRHGRAVPRRLVPQLHEPDGDQLPGDRPGEHASAPSACATACRAPRSSCRTTSASRTARSTTSRPASTTWRSTSASSATARTSIRGCAALRRVRRRSPSGNRVRYEMLQPPRLLRHRVERALRRVRAVVHQARPARPDRALQRPARRVPAPLRRADRRLGSGAANGSKAATRSRCSRSFEYAATIIRSIETGKPRVIYGNVPNDGLIDDLPAGCTRRGAVPRRRQRRAADARSARSRRSSPR